MELVKLSKMVEEKLHQIPFFRHYRVRKFSSSSFLAEIYFADGKEKVVEILALPRVYPSYLEEVASKKKPTAIIAPYVSERVAALCREKGISYFDYSGNCLFMGEDFYIHDSGHKNEHAEKRKGSSPFDRDSWVSSKVLRALFVDVKKVQKVSLLSKQTGVSIGQVSKVFNFLLDGLYMEKVDGGFLLKDPKTLLWDWAKVYNQKKLPSIPVYSLDQVPVIEKKISQAHKEGIKAYLGGFSGSMRYSPYVGYLRVHAYVAPEDVDSVMEKLGLEEVESGANLVIIPIPNDSYIVDSRIIDEEQLVSPLQMCLDVLGLGGRGEEEAESIFYKEILKE